MKTNPVSALEVVSSTLNNHDDPKPINSIENAVGYGISNQVKDKIIRGEYVEMSSLLEKKSV